MTIRQLGSDDAALWQSIRLEALRCEPDQFSARHSDWVNRPLADFADQLATAPVWAVIEDSRALAVASLTLDRDSARCGWIEGVYVRPEARGLAEVRLEVRAANPAARGLYARMGFAEVEPTGGACGSRCEISMAKAL